MDWASARERLRGPIFAPLHDLLAHLPGDDWPDHDALTALAEGVVTSRGRQVRFVPPRAGAEPAVPYYELHIAQTGEVPTRARNWHDLFNALAWVAYPAAKARINAQHAAILDQGGAREARHRSAQRDALTLFDEGGVIVACDAPELLELIRAFQWKALFWERRAQMRRSMRVWGFGHGFFEQALAPYVGMVAKTVFVTVAQEFFALPAREQRTRLDAGVAAHFGDRANFPSPRAMAPMPVLGIPGWHPDTARESFYDLASYFRSKPRRKPGTDPQFTA